MVKTIIENNNSNLNNYPILKPKSNKKIWLLIIILILVTMVVLLIFFFIKSDNLDAKRKKILNQKDKLNINNNGHIDKCYSQTHYDRTSCYIILGQIEKNLSICDQESVEGFKWLCYRGVGSIKQDVKICDMIPLDEKNNSIIFSDQNNSQIFKNREYCYQFAALFANDESFCEYNNDNYIKNLCYTFVATRKNDTEICNKINDTIGIIQNGEIKLRSYTIDTCKKTVSKGLTEIYNGKLPP